MIAQWSFSAWQTWNLCPARAKYRYVDRLPEPPNQYAQRGIEVHGMVEAYIKGVVPEYKHESDVVTKRVLEAKAIDGVQAEPFIGMSRKWEPAQFKTAWLRGKFDLMWSAGKVLNIVDLKTGKQRDSHGDQMELYACMGQRWANAERVKVSLWYMDLEKFTSINYHIVELAELRRKWNDAGKELTTAKRFPTRSGPHCKWCAYSKAKGGPCRY
jgi:CRISPR/Cas system-associated exonuclease Cas4 (RecB family)